MEGRAEIYGASILGQTEAVHKLPHWSFKLISWGRCYCGSHWKNNYGGNKVQIMKSCFRCNFQGLTQEGAIRGIWSKMCTEVEWTSWYQFWERLWAESLCTNRQVFHSRREQEPQGLELPVNPPRALLTKLRAQAGSRDCPENGSGCLTSPNSDHGQAICLWSCPFSNFHKDNMWFSWGFMS